MTSRRPVVFVVMVAVALGASACRSSRSESRLMQQATNLTVTAQELRIKVRALARPFGGMIEESAAVVAASTDDPDVRRLALEFRIDAVPAMHEALFRPDPLAALLDAAVLLVQMRDYFEATVADRIPAEQRALVLDQVERMRGEIVAMLVAAGSDPDKVADGWRLVEERAAELPVTDTFASRRSTVGLLAEFTSRTGARGLGAITSIQEDLDDLAERLDVYVAHLPKQGRWQAELLLLEVLGDTGTLAGGIREAAPIPIQLDAVPPWVEGLPDDIAAIVDAEHRRLETWVRAERLDTLRFVTAEREAVLAVVAAERALVLEAVASERAAVFEAVAAEREAALVDIRAIARDTLVEARSEVIDHAVVRLAQLLGGFGVLAFLAALVLVRVARGSGPARSA